MNWVLLVQRKQFIACQAGRGKVSGATLFDNSAGGVADFKQFLQEHHHTEFVVVLDLEAEQFHLQKIPRMNRRDQKSILQHHQRKHYGDTQYASGIVSNRKNPAEGRLGVTLIGLPADIEECVWLTQLADTRANVRSFHWMSLLIYPLANTAGLTSNLTVFIVRLSVGDDRIMVFEDGQPLICRRLAEQLVAASPLDESGADECATDESGTMLADQLRQTFAYLETQVEPAGMPVFSDNSMVVVAVGDLTVAEQEAIDRQLDVLGMNPMQVVSLSSLTDDSAVVSGTVAEVMAKSVLKTKSYRYSLIFRGAKFLERKLRHAMYACSISMFLGAAVASAAARYIEGDYSGLESMAVQIEGQALQLRQASLHPEWSDQYAIEAIRESVVHVNAIEVVNQSTPFHFLASLSEHLTRHPAIELKSIRWTGVDAEVINEVRDRAGGAMSSAVRDTGEHYPARGYHAVLTGNVELTPDGYSPAMGQFRSFVSSIRESAMASSPGTVVTVVNLPFGESRSAVSVAGALRGDFTLEVSSNRAEP